MAPVASGGSASPTAHAMIDAMGRGGITSALAVIALVASLTAAAPASAAKLRPVGDLRVSSVGTTSIDLRWKDRSKGESSYRFVATGGVQPTGGKVRRGSTGATVSGLDRGTVYELGVRACKGERCGPTGPTVRTATLLAPINGPHPDPGCEALPPGDDFNQTVTGDDVAPNSDAIIDRINADGGDDLHPDFGSNLRYGIPYTVVPSDQPTVPIRYEAYGDESDPGPFPVPPGAPVEGGPRGDGDRHVLVVRQPEIPGGDCDLFELGRAFEGGNSRNSWRADSGAIFDLGQPLLGQRPDGWTSADAAGLPIYPGLVTYEEVQSGVIDHAIRITFDRTRRGYFPPATHYASDSCNPSRPSMGLRLRLRDDYDIDGITGQAKVIATALRDYGVIVADNGSNWYISGSTDRRWNDDHLNQLKDIPGDAFEVVKPSAPESTPC